MLRQVPTWKKAVFGVLTVALVIAVVLFTNMKAENIDRSSYYDGYILGDWQINSIVGSGDVPEQYRLARTIDDIVANDGGYEREGDTVDDGLHAAEEQVRGADDGAVDELHGATEAHVEVLVEQYGDDIGATGRTIMREDQTQAGTTHSTTYEHVHELVLARRDDRVCLEERL